MQAIPAALDAFRGVRQAIVCKLVPDSARPGKTTKLPADWRTGSVADAHDPATWTDLDTAVAMATFYGPGYAPGFVFTADDPFWFLDIDDCLLPTGQWSPLAYELLGMLPGAAVEVSQSGRGLHVFGQGAAPAHSCKNTALRLEFYTEKRFVVLTGTNAIGSADTVLDVAPLVARYFPPPVTASPAEWSDGPCEGWDGHADDTELLTHARNARSAAGAFGGLTFSQLFDGDDEALGRAFPDPARSYDASSADASLSQRLAFWTGRDCARIERLMRQSALVRDKWERADYLPRTILRACATQVEVHQRTHHTPVETAAATRYEQDGETLLSVEPSKREGSAYIGPNQQLEIFAGCCYVTDIHAVRIPGGELLSPERFNARYGGLVYQLDWENTKTTRKAFEAFTESNCIRWPKASGTCFRPDLPASAIVEEDGRALANIWAPIEVRRTSGDPAPFLRHLEWMLPNSRDRAILLAYMAACVQHQGVKFQWAPLVQGVEGNGKTMLSHVVARAIGRRYVHWPKASELDNKFNGWVHGHTFASIEDIKVPESQAAILEALKPIVTNNMLEVEFKGRDQVTLRVCCNLMLNSNYQDGIRKTSNDRRYATFFCAQQRVEDLAGYDVPAVYTWLDGDGYAIMADYLWSYQIPDELNPAKGCKRAPVTSSTAEAISAGMGTIEQEIMEAIEQEQPGFAGGWVSLHMVGRLLEDKRLAGRLPLNKREALLQALGYVPHPALNRSNGRVNNPVLPDGTKTKLYVRAGHISMNFPSASEAARAYTAAQGVLPKASAVFGS